MALILTSLIKAKDGGGRGPRSQTAHSLRKTFLFLLLKPFSLHFLSLVSSCPFLETQLRHPTWGRRPGPTVPLSAGPCFHTLHGSLDIRSFPLACKVPRTRAGDWFCHPVLSTEPDTSGSGWMLLVFHLLACRWFLPYSMHAFASWLRKQVYLQAFLKKSKHIYLYLIKSWGI